MLPERLKDTLQHLENAANVSHRPAPKLLAVSKTKSATAIATLARAGQRAFGENYVQEAQSKTSELASLDLEWHLIGHLQSNKAEMAARIFDWVQTVDRNKLVTALARYRSPDAPPLNVLIQVNIDDEASKHGCAPGDVAGLATAIAQQPQLRLRGLMAIPAPHPDTELRRSAYRKMAELFKVVAERHEHVDTLSMGMSDDFALAIEEGATMVRIGSALFGAREPKTEDSNG